MYYGEAITYSVTPERGYYVNDLGKTITVDTTNPLIYITPNKLKATYMCDDRCTGYVTFGK